MDYNITLFRGNKIFDEFLTNFLCHSKIIVVLSLNLKKIFHLWSFFVKLWGFKNLHFGQFGTINARYILRY